VVICQFQTIYMYEIPKINNFMLLSNNGEHELKIGGYMNYQSETLGTDSPKLCHKLSYYNNFPYKFNYSFNSLGYRERPVEEYLTNAIITIGDSATIGIGIPANLSYAHNLEILSNHQVLNFSMCGASNDWMARKLEIILKYFDPKAIIIHYSFIHRREKNEPTWFDDERTLCEPCFNEIEDCENWIFNHKKITSLVNNIPTVYSAIPTWKPTDRLIPYHIIETKQVDFARDYFHYGPITCANLAKIYFECINQQ